MKQETKRSLGQIARRSSDMARHVPLPSNEAIETDRWTEILFRALSSRVAKRWRFVSFRGPKKREFCGIVDVIAIRKDTSKSDHEILRMGDLFDIILVQMKGGSAPLPTAEDRARLRAVGERYHVRKVVLFQWKRGKRCSFSVLDRDTWRPSRVIEIFGS